jgi:hypothetical protein
LKIKNPAQSPAAIMTILRPLGAGATNWGGNEDEDEDEEGECVPQQFKDKIEQFKDKIEKKIPVDVKPKEQKPVAGRPMPSMVRLECLSALREFGPFYATRKPNNTLVLIDPNHVGTDLKPWKSGHCLRTVKGGGKAIMDGNGGPWASFHVEPVVLDASGGGGAPVSSSNVVRLVCGNRKQCLGAANGQLVSMPVSSNGIDTHFKFHEASSSDEIDPVWDSMTWEKSENKAASASGCWEQPSSSSSTVDEQQPFWEGMSNSIIEDVKAAMAANESTNVVAPPPPAPRAALPAVSFVRDMTIEDGERIAVNTPFVKTWRLRNDSDFPFPSGVRLIHVGGNEMGSKGEVSLGSKVIHPFEEFEVSVPMITPTKPGKYASFWRLEVANERFGHQVWVEVNVFEPPKNLESLMKQAQEESEKIAAAKKVKSEQDKEQERVLQEIARAQAEEVLAVEAAIEAERLEKLRLEKLAREQQAQDELALAEAEKAHAEALQKELELAEAAAREQAELAEAARIEAERLHELELVAMVEAEEKRAAAEMEEANKAKEAEEESNNKADDGENNSIDWEHVDVMGNEDESNEDAAAAEKNEDVDSEGSFDPYASDLSASVEGAAMAGAALNNSGLSESVVAVLDSHSFEESMGKWGSAVTRLFEMGFDDVNSIVAACEKHATPENYESNLEAIVNEMFSVQSTN